MATIKRFEDLECWQQARELVKMVYSFKTNLTNKTYTTRFLIPLFYGFTIILS